MSETIATRVARIIAGSAHALLDKAENLAPDAVMAQAIRDIEQVAGEVRIDLGKAEAAKHLIAAQMSKLNDEHAQLAGRIETAIGQQRDDLASAAIGRQADIEDYLPVLQKALDEQAARAKDLASYILALLAKKRELEQVLAEYQRHPGGGQADTVPQASPIDRQARVDDAEATFERVLARQLGVSGLAGANLEDAAKLKELAQLQRDNRIAERLAAAKLARRQD